MLESVFQFLGDRVRELTPFRIIRTYERGVDFRFGVAQPVALEPGFHWRIPGFQEIEKVTVVQDAAPHFCNVTDFATSLQTICEVHLAEKMGQLTLDQICDDRAEIEKSLRRSLGQRVSKWGVKIVDAGLTNIQEVKAFQVYGLSRGFL
jgi:regulator of protease activity HflC (stomatin/prohibitin superfamily)